MKYHVLGLPTGYQVLDRKTFALIKLDQKITHGTEITSVENISRVASWFGSTKVPLNYVKMANMTITLQNDGWFRRSGDRHVRRSLRKCFWS